MFSLRQGFLCLLLLEAHAVGALIHGGVGLMGADVDLAERTVVLGVAVIIADDTTYTAAWTANTYTVQYLPNGGTGEMAAQTFT